LEDELFLVFHLMIAGRFRWKEPGAKVPGKVGLAAFDFPAGTLILTEAGSQRQTSLHVVRGRAALAGHDPGGLDVFTIELPAFAERLRSESHTSSARSPIRGCSRHRQRLLDEILLAARLSPLQLTGRLNDADVARLFEAVRAPAHDVKERLIRGAGDAFPEKVTAFRGDDRTRPLWPACPVCGTTIQRISCAPTKPITARRARPGAAAG
jgi:formamidopyrimidine-DNA glycosylase